MLIKEYRILLPLTTEEYRIAQLFMIQKKSRLESSGVGSGVEIINNEPYEDEPSGTSGQYTYKIYHIGNRIPIWIRNVLPSSALEAHEESWNSYPYTRTRYSCPLISHFFVEVETKYLDDAGQTENIFKLNKDELRNRAIDIIDFVQDTISSHDYCQEEDPKIYKSKITGRGPLNDNWVEESIQLGKPVMCAYKLCKVEFKYWGLQTRAERWIHELALRGTMLRAHRQAWAWQDEWYNLSIDDIRLLEMETQQYLATLMSPRFQSIEDKEDMDIQPINGLIPDKTNPNIDDDGVDRDNGSNDSTSSNSDKFFDCSDKILEESVKEHKQTLVRWSSELLVNEDDLEKSPPRTPRLTRKSLLIMVFHGDLYPKTSADSKITDAYTLRTTLESLISNHYSQLKNRVHVICVTCGSELAPIAQLLNGLCSPFGIFHPSLGPFLACDTINFNAAIDSTINNAHKVLNHFLSSATGKAFEKDNYEIFVVGDFIGGILMYEALARTALVLNSKGISTMENDFNQKSQMTNYHHSPVKATISSAAYPISSGQTSSGISIAKESQSAGPSLESGSNQIFDFEHKNAHKIKQNNHSLEDKFASELQQMSTISFESEQSPVNENIFSFRPSAAFLLGCPLAFMLLQRKIIKKGEQNLALSCDQLFNLYYNLDLCAARLEPVLNSSLALLTVPKVPRYQRFHLLGDGHDIHFENTALLETPMIWGNRRVDHELYCPPEMSSLPAMALPSILHASYWESKDVSSFILRQFLRFDELPYPILTLKNIADQPPLQFQMPLTVWNRRRTRFKVANLSANHRSNDCIVVEGEEPIIHAKFCYGPMDLVVLSQEDVLVYLLPSDGEWYLRGVETTDNHGKLTINLGKLPIGIHHLRLIVKGDHTFLSVSIAVVPHATPIVVFSIDGSLTASVSVTGRDPRLRPGAIDVVRFWQQQGYLIIYLTARPDMQQRLVSAWLSTHNFPHGLLFFTPSLSTEPLKQKMQFMKSLVDMGLCIHAAYGSAKDVPVYSNAGLEPQRIFKVGGNRRKHATDCISLDNGYSTHLHDLHSGRVVIAQPATYIHPFSSSSSTIYGTTGDIRDSSYEQQKGIGSQKNSPIQRTLSFGPRTGKYFCSKKISQASAISSNY